MTDETKPARADNTPADLLAWLDAHVKAGCVLDVRKDAGGRVLVTTKPAPNSTHHFQFAGATAAEALKSCAATVERVGVDS